MENIEYHIQTAESDLEASRYQQGRIEELTAENERLKSEREHAINFHATTLTTVLELRRQVAELKAAQTPRPMSDAPEEGQRIRIVRDGTYNKARGLVNVTLGWLPLPVVQGES